MSEEQNLPYEIQSREGFTAAVTQLKGLLFTVSYSILHDRERCADAVQNAILRAWRRRNTLRDSANCKAWLVRIAINDSKRLLRADESLPLSEDVPAASKDESVRIDVMNAVMRLDERYRVPVALYYFEDLSVNEIAKVLHKPKGTVVSLLSRARNLLREELNTYDV